METNNAAEHLANTINQLVIDVLAGRGTVEDAAQYLASKGVSDGLHWMCIGFAALDEVAA